MTMGPGRMSTRIPMPEAGPKPPKLEAPTLEAPTLEAPTLEAPMLEARCTRVAAALACRNGRDQEPHMTGAMHRHPGLLRP